MLATKRKYPILNKINHQSFNFSFKKSLIIFKIPSEIHKKIKKKKKGKKIKVKISIIFS
jgi:hypothetical protein